MSRKHKNKLKIPQTCYYTNIPFDMSKYNGDWYPSIDHKTSILFGFLNNISPDDIASEKNLCYCARLVNSVKRIDRTVIFIIRGAEQNTRIL